ncbi:MAG: hybrid sensor histidine kinase/response regulator [Chloracidobacterium sp. CP2_5A]|nr:MAG: hybrid sensor histidine kinase/response regulator [Chloracidobacterium sp. CP2_5A]
MSVKILIAEDDPASRALLQIWLRKDGYDITSVDNGRAALEAARQILPDLVLSDVMMPEMDGFELCQALRADPLLGEVPIVLVTTLSDKASRLQGIEAGADDFLSKPYDNAELRARVRTITRLNRYRLLLQEREQRAAERAAHAARLKELAELLDQTQDAIVQIDDQGRVAFWSAGAARMFGWSPEEATGRAARELLFPKADELPREAMAAVAERGDWTGELVTQRRDGQECVLMTRWSAITRAADGARSTLLIATDVTEQRRIERQYLRAQRLETIGMLASGVAHDLNNMLTPIGIGVELLRQQAAGSTMTDVLDMMDSSVQRGAALIKQILSLARGGGADSRVQPKHILREAFSLARETFPKSIEVRVDYPPNLWTIQGDPTELTQILLNLSVNARDAMPSGGMLALAARNVQTDDALRAKHPRATAERYVEIEVADTGTGIPPEIQARIFEPFFTTKSQGQGTGLGLATVASLVDKRGGFIALESEVGRGTVFRLYFPAAETAAERSSAPETAPGGQGELVLVADTEASILDLLRTVLESNGYRVIAARDGAELEDGLGQRPAAAIIDAELPALSRTLSQSGLALALAAQPDLPLIALCKETVLGCRQRAAHLPVRAWLSKPFTAAQALRALRAALDS